MGVAVRKLVRALGSGICASLLAGATALAQVVADAGEDVTVECAGPRGARVTLDGSGSSPDAALRWEAPGVVFDHPTAVSPTGLFPPGTTHVTLTATVGSASAQDQVLVRVVDETPPVAYARAVPDTLWPPDHRLVEVHVRLHATDACTPHPEVTLISADSSEPDDGMGDGHTTDDIQDADLGSDDRVVSLRAERSGGGPGRVYTLTYRVSDDAGNHTYVTVRVRVPHDQGNDDDEEDGDDDGSDHDSDRICPLPSEATREWLDRSPDPEDFPAPRACASACRSWESACRRISGEAHGCTVAEARGALALERVRCAQLEHPERRMRCLRKLAELRDSLQRALRRDDEIAKQRCDSGARECREVCEAG
jgi:hypothetical protein